MSGLTLFDLDNKYIELMAQIEKNDGVMSDDLAVEFDQVCDALIKKEAQYIKVVNHYDTVIEQADKWLKLFQVKKRSLENQKQRLKERVIMHMEAMKLEVIETELGKIRLMSKESVDADTGQLSEEYIRTKIIKEADKQKIAADLKSGKDVRGAKFVKKFFIKVT